MNDRKTHDPLRVNARNLRRLSPHPSAGGAADTFSPKGRRLPPVLKASPEGLRPQARVGAQPPKAALSA